MELDQETLAALLGEAEERLIFFQSQLSLVWYEEVGKNRNETEKAAAAVKQYAQRRRAWCKLTDGLLLLFGSVKALRPWKTITLDMNSKVRDWDEVNLNSSSLFYIPSAFFENEFIDSFEYNGPSQGGDESGSQPLLFTDTRTAPTGPSVAPSLIATNTQKGDASFMFLLWSQGEAFLFECHNEGTKVDWLKELTSVIATFIMPALRTKRIKEWAPEDVALWLETVELGQYSPHFCEQSVSGEILSEIQRDDLKELGMKKLGHRLRFLRALEQLLAYHDGHSDLTEETDLSSIDSSLSVGCLEPELLIDCKLPETHSRLIRVPRNASLQELIHRVEGKLSDLFYPAKLGYKDSDGDLVSLLSEADYIAARTLSPEPGVLRLYAFPSSTQQKNNSSTRSPQSNDTTSRTKRNHALCMTQRHRPTLSSSSATKQRYERIATDGDEDEMIFRERVASNNEETGGIRASFIAMKVVMDDKTTTEGGSSLKSKECGQKEKKKAKKKTKIKVKKELRQRSVQEAVPNNQNPKHRQR